MAIKCSKCGKPREDIPTDQRVPGWCQCGKSASWSFKWSGWSLNRFTPKPKGE